MLLSQMKLVIVVNLLSDKIFNIPSLSESSPWVQIHDADQKARGLWGRDWLKANNNQAINKM